MEAVHCYVQSGPPTTSDQSYSVYIQMALLHTNKDPEFLLMCIDVDCAWETICALPYLLEMLASNIRSMGVACFVIGEFPVRLAVQV